MNNLLSVDLTGKVALITGSANGLGAYYAEVLAKNGAHVVVSGHSRADKQLDNVIDKIISSGYKASKAILDMSDFDNFDNVVNNIVDKLGHINILINNAAISVDKGVFELSTSDWDSHMNVNLKGLFFLSQRVAKQMKNQQSGGTIINIAALNGQKSRRNCIAFGTSKAGVIHLTKLMAYELIDHKIRVNGISLGLIESSKQVKDFVENDPKASYYIDQIPAKRVGQLADVEGPILLLSSDAASYMYGTILNVDGGFSADVFMNVDIHA